MSCYAPWKECHHSLTFRQSDKTRIFIALSHCSSACTCSLARRAEYAASLINNSILAYTFTCNSYTPSVLCILSIALCFFFQNIAFEDITNLQRLVPYTCFWQSYSVTVSPFILLSVTSQISALASYSIHIFEGLHSIYTKQDFCLHAKYGELIIQTQHFCHNGDTVCHTKTSYVAIKLHVRNVCMWMQQLGICLGWKGK